MAPSARAGRRSGGARVTPGAVSRLLRYLAGLRTAHPVARLAGFALIGLTGLVPNLAALRLLLAWGVPALPAEVLANQCGLAWNFLLLDTLLYPERRHLRHGADRAGRFLLLANADLVARLPLAALLVRRLGLTVLPATTLALALTWAVRCAATEGLIYRARGPRTGTRPAHTPTGRRRPTPDRRQSAAEDRKLP